MMWFFNQKITKHKFIEIQFNINKEIWSIFSLDIDYLSKLDHPGFVFNVNLLWFYFGLEIRDSRHWNDEKGELE